MGMNLNIDGLSYGSNQATDSGNDEPLKYLHYIEDLKTHGENAYCLRSGNRHMFEDLVMHSTAVYGDDTINVLNHMTNDLIDKVLYRDDFGKVMNLIHMTDTYQDGNVDDLIRSGITAKQLGAITSKIRTRIENRLTTIFNNGYGDGIGKAIADFYNIDSPTLIATQTTTEISKSKDCLKAIFGTSGTTSLLNITYFKDTMDSKLFYEVLNDEEVRNVTLPKLQVDYQKTGTSSTTKTFLISLKPDGGNYHVVNGVTYYAARSGYDYILTNGTGKTEATQGGTSSSTETYLKFDTIMINSAAASFSSRPVKMMSNNNGNTGSTTHNTTFTYISLA